MQTTETTRTHASLRDEVDRFFAGMGQGFNPYLETLSRAPELERLNALSDEQLARQGLRREDIVRHVFRDRFHV